MHLCGSSVAHAELDAAYYLSENYYDFKGVKMRCRLWHFAKDACMRGLFGRGLQGVVVWARDSKLVVSHTEVGEVGHPWSPWEEESVLQVQVVVEEVNMAKEERRGCFEDQ